MVAGVKRTRLIVGVLLISVAGLVLLSSILALHGMGSNQSNASQQTSSSNSPSYSQSFSGPVTFQLGSNVSELSVTAGSSVQGAVPIKITGVFSFNFYVDDRGFNTTKSALPAGISVSLDMYGKSYDAVPLTVMFANLGSPPLVPAALLQLVPTDLGETAVQYTVSVASSVPAGVYNVLIVFQSVTNTGELYGFERGTLHYDYGAIYKVILYVL
jgi:hypothetical protein